MVMDVVLRAESISKSFGPIEVLSGVDLDLRPGEIHAIIGENGAGKSTLMKIVSGHLAPTNGHLYFSGQPVVFSTPSEAEKLGIVLVHQEILLAADLTVAQNIFLGREISRHGLVDDRAMRAQADAILAQLGSDIHSDTHVRELSIADRQIVQIARALLVPNHIVVFDEPTAVLTPIEAESLFQIIRRLRSQGVGILYISHRLSEVKAIADRVTVLRDGKLVATRDIEGFEPIEMARLMVGRDMSKLYPEKPTSASDQIVLSVASASVPGHVTDVSFALRRGEILGFGGLIGAGRTELFEGLVGLRPFKGTVTLDGSAVSFGDVRDAMAAGIVYLSEDRKGKGLLLRQNLRTNLTLTALDQFTRGSFIDVGARMQRLMQPLVISTSGHAVAICSRANCPAATSRSCCLPR